MDKYGLFVNNVANVRYCPKRNLNIPVQRKREHVYLKWSSESAIMYKHTELIKLHLNFFHPASEKPINLPKLAVSWEANSETKAILEEIQTKFDTFQRYSAGPIRFKVSMPSIMNSYLQKDYS